MRSSALGQCTAVKPDHNWEEFSFGNCMRVVDVEYGTILVSTVN
jgi:hypothetical protein